MEIQCVLCVDVGTSSLKAACITEDGEVLSYHREFFAGNDFSHPAIYKNAFLKAAMEVLSSDDVAEKTRVAAISVSGNGPTIAAEDFLLQWDFPIDDDEKIDTKSLFIPRLFYIKQRLPRVWEATAQFSSGPEFLIYMLSGQKVTLLPEKRFEAAYWTEEELRKFGISSRKLPPYVGFGEVCGHLLPKTAAELGLSEIPIFCAGPDFTAAMIGTNTLWPGNACDRAGTSEGINFCTTVPRFASGLRTLPSVIPDLWNISCVINDSGARFSQFKNQSKYRDLSFDKTMEDILQHRQSPGFSLIEGIALEVKSAMEKIECVTGEKFQSMCVTGAQAHNKAWLEFKSRILELPLYVTGCTDAELVGNAAVAFFGLKKFSSLREAANHIVKIDYAVG